jgi:hypothetical protein
MKILYIFPHPDDESCFVQGRSRLKQSEMSLIDCIIPLAKDDIQALKDSLKCYTTYKDTIEKTGVIEQIVDRVF